MAKQNEKPKDEIQDPVAEIETIEECFIITPIGAYGSDVYKKAMGLIDAVIDPVLRERKMKAMPANRMPDLGSINKQLIKRVVEDRLVIANLTDLNANVMYELAVRHAARKPVIIMAEEGTRLPFDITDQRTIFYSDTLSGVEAAKVELRKKIDYALKDETPDNPIYSYLENAELFKKVADSDFNKSVLNMLVLLDEKVSAANNSSNMKRVSSYPMTVSPGKPWAFEIENGYRYVLVVLSKNSRDSENFQDVYNNVNEILSNYFGSNAPELVVTQQGFLFETPSSTDIGTLRQLDKKISSLSGVEKVQMTPF